MNTETLIERVARIANRERKSNKAETFEALRTVIDHLAVLERMTREPNITADDMKAYLRGCDPVLELATLYKHYMPAAPRKPRTVFEWVALARGKKDVREYLDYVYVTPDRIVASDGHRLHSAPNADGLAPGYYNGAGDKIYEPSHWQYPDFDRITPTPNKDNRDVTLPAEPPATVRSRKGSATLTAVTLEHDDTTMQAVHVNKVYWKAAVSMEPSHQRDMGVHTLLGDRYSAVRLNLPGDRVAVIMPLRD